MVFAEVEFELPSTSQFGDADGITTRPAPFTTVAIVAAVAAAVAAA